LSPQEDRISTERWFSFEEAQKMDDSMNQVRILIIERLREEMYATAKLR
jgi:hypothetical protein